MAKKMYQKRKERQLKINEKNDDKGGLQKTDINWDAPTDRKPHSSPYKMGIF